MRPLDVDDLSRAILRLCETRPEGAAIHELVGPESIPYRELIERVSGMMGKKLSIGSSPIWVAKLGAAFTSRFNGGGISPTVIDVITTNEVVQKNADADLGVHLTPLSTTLEKILPKTKQSTEEHST
jgi:nucleoside-diphosphate-sugar epimerase